ncbi:MAG: N-acetylmuramoyl-L-alanine amidase [Peptococcaceae bacterium]|nr:N-acetylmuramoyl-L-alanine amidase [Peptococcaceae bacterium]
MFKIADDAGHGGRDSGAIGPTGVKEKNITLSVAKQVADILKHIVDVRLTREDDRELGPTKDADLQARVNVANNWNADIFVSIHCNSADDKSAHGCEVWTTPGQTQADILAESIIEAMETALPELTFRKDYTDGDSDKEAKFAVLTRTKMPAVLIELAFISNPTEEALLESPAFQARAAIAIAKGIANFLGVQLPVPEEDIEIWQADMGINAIYNLNANDLITRPDYWVDKIANKTPLWLFFEMIRRLNERIESR